MWRTIHPSKVRLLSKWSDSSVMLCLSTADEKGQRFCLVAGLIQYLMEAFTKAWLLLARIKWFITARKRSLGQGNKFTGVCLSTGEGVSNFSEGGRFLQFFGGSSNFLGGSPNFFSKRGQRVGGTHPTGMHSCLWCNSTFSSDYRKTEQDY